MWLCQAQAVCRAQGTAVPLTTLWTAEHLMHVPQRLCSHTKLSVEVSCSDPSPAQQACLLNIENPNTNVLLQAQRITKGEMSVN